MTKQEQTAIMRLWFQSTEKITPYQWMELHEVHGEGINQSFKPYEDEFYHRTGKEGCKDQSDVEYQDGNTERYCHFDTELSGSLQESEP